MLVIMVMKMATDNGSCCGQTCWLHMKVVDVDLGTGVPHIRNLQALASPTATIWPQALFDLEFTGPSTASAGLFDTLGCLPLHGC